MRRFAHSTCFLVPRLLLSNGWNRESFLDRFTAFTFTFLETWLCVFLSPNYRGYYQPFSCAGEPRFSSWGKCLHKFQSCRSTYIISAASACYCTHAYCMSVCLQMLAPCEWMKSFFWSKRMNEIKILFSMNSSLSFNPSPVDFSQLIPTTHAWESPIFLKEKKEKTVPSSSMNSVVWSWQETVFY